SWLKSHGRWDSPPPNSPKRKGPSCNVVFIMSRLYAGFVKFVKLPPLAGCSGGHSCNENTVVKPPFVSSRRILTLVIGDKAKTLCVLSELRLKTWASVLHMVSADSRRRKYISTSHDRSQQWLFGSLVGTSAGNICFGNNNPFS